MIYIIFFLIILLFAYYYDFRNYIHKGNNLYWVVAITLILLLGLRYRIGGDTIGYMKYYNTVPTFFNLDIEYLIKTEKELKYGIFWSILVSFCKTISPSFIFFQIAHALIVNIIIFKTIKRHSLNKFTNILFYFSAYLLYFNMEILRESIAICIFLLTYNSLENKKWIKYYIGILIAIQFHISATILIFLPIMLYINRLNYRSIILLICILSIVFPLFKSTLLSLFLKFTNDEFLIRKVLNYSSYTGNIKGIFFSMSFKVFLPLIILFVNEKLLKHNSKIRIYFLSYILFSLFSIYLNPFQRFSNYFIPFYFIFVVEFFENVYNSIVFRRIRKPVIFLFSSIILVQASYYYFKDTSSRVENTRFYKRYVPYYTVFSKKIDDKRETLVRTYNPNDSLFYKEK